MKATSFPKPGTDREIPLIRDIDSFIAFNGLVGLLIVFVGILFYSTYRLNDTWFSTFGTFWAVGSSMMAVAAYAYWSQSLVRRVRELVGLELAYGVACMAVCIASCLTATSGFYVSTPTGQVFVAEYGHRGVMSIMAVLLGWIPIIMAFGLWTGRRYAWYAALGLSAAEFPILWLALSERSNMVAIIFLAGLQMVVLRYLLLPSVRSHYVSRASPSGWTTT